MALGIKEPPLWTSHTAFAWRLERQAALHRRLRRQCRSGGRVPGSDDRVKGNADSDLRRPLFLFSSLCRCSCRVGNWGLDLRPALGLW